MPRKASSTESASSFCVGVTVPRKASSTGPASTSCVAAATVLDKH